MKYNSEEIARRIFEKTPTGCYDAFVDLVVENYNGSQNNSIVRIVDIVNKRNKCQTFTNKPIAVDDMDWEIFYNNLKTNGWTVTFFRVSLEDRYFQVENVIEM